MRILPARWRRFLEIMLHKIAIIGALATILYIVYTSLYKGYILIPLLVLLALLAAIYYITTSIVTSSMVDKKEKKKTISFRGGLVDGSNLIPGRLAFDEEKIVFYKRKGDLGGVSECFSIPVENLASYNVGNINEYHSGIKLVSSDGSEYSIKCRDIFKEEGTFVSTIGWTLSEEDEENEED